MKKAFLLIPVLAAVLAGCKAVELEQLEAAQDQRITIVASREGDGPETRTVRNESNGKILWSPGDQISLFYGSGTDGGSLFTSQTTTNAAVTNFTGTIGVITGGADVSVDQPYFWGLYPYDGTASCDGASITTTLPAYQVATPGSFAPNTFLSVGRSPGLNMAFYNICGGLMIRVQKEGVRKVTLHSNDGPIAGKARIVLDDSGIPSVAEIIDGSDDIVLEAPEGQYLEPGVNYYFVTFPHEFANQYFTLTFETYTEIGTYERKKPFTITRSNFESFTVAIDGNVTYELKEGNIPVSDSGFKSYLVNNYDDNGDGEISFAEALTVTKIDSGEIVNLEGIEYFSNLDTLRVNPQSGPMLSWIVGLDQTLEEALQEKPDYLEYYLDNVPGHLENTNLDLSNNRKLKCVDIFGALLLESIDLSKCEDLETLVFRVSMMTPGATIDLTHNPKLQGLNLSGCMLEGTLDLSNCPDLKTFISDVNGFSEIILGQKPDLETISIQDGYLPFETLSLEAYPELKTLDISYRVISTGVGSGGSDGRDAYASGRLKSLDVSHNPKLKYLYCSGCNIEDPLDLSNCADLIHVVAFYNEFEEITLGNHPNLKTLYLAGCWHLTELDLTGCPSLEWISTYFCHALGPVDYTSCTQLKTLKRPPMGSDLSACSQVESYDGDPSFLPDFPHLKEYSTWHFSSLDLSANTELERLTIGTTNCTTIDLSPLVNLKSLNVDGWSTLEIIDISHNLLLENVSFGASEALRILYVAEGQEIEGITVNRSDTKIHPNTQIMIAPTVGGNEGSGEHQNEP